MRVFTWFVIVAAVAITGLTGCALEPPRAEWSVPLAETNASKSGDDVRRELVAAGWLALASSGSVRQPHLNFILPSSLEQVGDVALVTTRTVLGADSAERTTSRTVTSEWEVNCSLGTSRVVRAETSLDLMGQRKIDKTDSSSLPPRPHAQTPLAPQVAALACPLPTTVGSGIVAGTEQVLTASVVTRLCVGVAVVMDGQRFAANVVTDDANHHQSMLKVPNLPKKRALQFGRLTHDGEPVVAAGYANRGSSLDNIERLTGFVQAQAPTNDVNTLRLSAPLLSSQVGGPVLNRSGQLVGLLLSRRGGAETVKPEVVNAFLVLNGAALPQGIPAPPLDSETLLRRAREVTVKVECLGRPAPLIGAR